MSSVDYNQRASFDTLLRPHLDRLYRFAYRLTGSKAEAEDLFQDVLLKAFARLDDLLEVSQGRGWSVSRRTSFPDRA
jgi:DNA-directed RNA polymerase specialized sigma24 family protein